jgi:hypothetical protein
MSPSFCKNLPPVARLIFELKCRALSLLWDTGLEKGLIFDAYHSFPIGT